MFNTLLSCVFLFGWQEVSTNTNQYISLRETSFKISLKSVGLRTTLAPPGPCTVWGAVEAGPELPGCCRGTGCHKGLWRRQRVAHTGHSVTRGLDLTPLWGLSSAGFCDLSRDLTLSFGWDAKHGLLGAQLLLQAHAARSVPVCVHRGHGLLARLEGDRRKAVLSPDCFLWLQGGEDEVEDEVSKGVPTLRGRWHAACRGSSLVCEGKWERAVPREEQSPSGPTGQRLWDGAVEAGPCQGWKLGGRWAGAASTMDAPRRQDTWYDLQPHEVKVLCPPQHEVGVLPPGIAGPPTFFFLLPQKRTAAPCPVEMKQCRPSAPLPAASRRQITWVCHSSNNAGYI